MRFLSGDPKRTMGSVESKIKGLVKSFLTFHFPNELKNVFLFAIPRGGSTWVMELLQTQPGYKIENEPFDLRNKLVRDHTGISEWKELYNSGIEEKIKPYIELKCKGKLLSSTPPIFEPYHRLITHATIFKILHAFEDKINWFRDSFNGKVVFLIRHPIPVSISRGNCPRIDTFIESDYKNHFEKEHLQYAEKIIKNGSMLERVVLSWCFQNYVPLKMIEEDWAVISYEQLVLDPVPVVNYLCKKLNLQKPERIFKRLNIPSESTHLSDSKTQSILKSHDDENRKKYLIEKWRKKIAPEKEDKLMEILKIFNIDAYSSGSSLPDEKYWIH